MRNRFPRLNLSGQKFGRLLAVKDVGSSRDKRRIWECKCDCGSIISVPSVRLKTGLTRSCGCLRKETASITGKTTNVKHGLEGTAVYRSWSAMRTRCLNSRDAGFVNYGARGIKICQFLQFSPANLLQVIGHRPSPKLSLNRIDNEKHYSCGSCPQCRDNAWSLNVEWATRTEQNRNSRNNVLIDWNGEYRCAAEWSEITGIPSGTILWRFYHKWTPDRMFTKGQCRT